MDNQSILCTITLPTIMTLADGSKVDKVHYREDGTICGEKPDASQSLLMLRGLYDHEADLEVRLGQIDGEKWQIRHMLDVLAKAKRMLREPTQPRDA